jgi:hypothetical protein
MKKIIRILFLLQFNLIFFGLFAQINVTTKLDMDKSMGIQSAGEFQARIFNAALSGKIKVYKDDSFARKISITEIKDLLNNDQTIPIFPDTNDPGMYYDSVIKKTITEKDITGILACALFYPDLRKRQYSVSYRAFALSTRISKAGFDLGEQPLYWFGIDDLAVIFNPAEMIKFRAAIMKSTTYFYNDQNPAAGNTMHEVKLGKYIAKNALTKFNYKIFNGTTIGTLASYEDKDFTVPQKPQDIQKKQVLFTIIIHPPDFSHPDTKVDSTVLPITPDSISRYFVTENLLLNENKLSFSVQFLGFASGYNFMNNNVPEGKILFWTKFSDMASVLGEPDCAGMVRIIFKATRDRFDVYFRE